MSTARDVVTMLQRHYQPDNRPPAGIFAAEIGSPCGRRRADALWLPTTISGGTGLVGHEIKVSRADVLVELADPAKADPWAQYCDQWWLVVAAPALIDGLSIPDAWGVLAPPSGRRTRSMTVVRPAPQLKPLDPSPGFRRLLSWQMHRAHEAEATMQSDARWREREIEQLRAEVDRLRVSQKGATNPHALRVARILRLIEQQKRSAWLYMDQSDEDVAAALVDTLRVREATRAAQREVDEMVRQLDRICSGQAAQRLRDELKRVLDPSGAAGAA